MRSSGNHPGPVIATAVAVWLSVSGVAAAQTAKVRFETAAERDQRVRVLLTNHAEATPPGDLITQVTQVMSSFESIVRRFPTSGYADNALWQAASLADAAYQRFNRAEDRDRAIRMYQWLVKEYPASSLVTRANAKMTSLKNAAVSTTPPPVAPPVQNLPAAAAPIAPPATLTNIHRTVLPDTVRVTLDLDREVTYREERLSGPERLFFDLRNVQLTPALMDKVLTYSSDVVSKIRVGRHPDNTVRVVLDFQDVAKYSVFTLYGPFRLVIDAERQVARTVTAPTGGAPLAIESTPPIAPVVETPVLVAATPTSVVPTAPPAAPAANAAGGFSMARQLGLSVSRIVIDPGHGGHDPGVLGRGLNEATLALDVALRLEKLLQMEPGIEVVLTRRTDVYVPLEERTEIANRHSADMFLSIHANASRNTSAKGIETFFLSFASSPEAEAVAARENSASTRDMHHLSDLVKKITLNNKLDESRDLANMVQQALVTNLRKTNKGVTSRGVKKAPFVVLIGAEMPSVLAEISFVSNKQELSLLKTSAYKQKIAESLYNAVMKYRRSLKTQTTLTLPER